MLEGRLTFEFEGRLDVRRVAVIQFPDFRFMIREKEVPHSCEVFQLMTGGGEEKIGESTATQGFPFFSKRREILTFVIGREAIAIEYGVFNNSVIYKGERKKILFQLNILEDARPEQTDEEIVTPYEPEKPPEWRCFEIGGLRLEHHDYESHYRLFAPDETGGLLIAFTALRLFPDSGKRA